MGTSISSAWESCGFPPGSRESLAAFVLWFGWTWAVRHVPYFLVMCQTGTGEMHALGSARALSVAQRLKCWGKSCSLDLQPRVPRSRGGTPAVPGAEFSPWLWLVQPFFPPPLFDPIFKTGIMHLDSQLPLKNWEMWRQWAYFSLWQ